MLRKGISKIKRRATFWKLFCSTDRPAGLFRKRAPHDCGHTRCACCHPHKYPRRQPTRQEVRAGLYDG